MMEKIVFASNNPHKLEELRKMVGPELAILSLSDIGCNDDIPETADTLEGNALIKASWVKEHYGYDCFADDTGLEVEALGGAPGVHSARYAPGEGHDSKANTDLLLKNLAGESNRNARFRTVIALIKGHDTYMVDGIVEGHITATPAGGGGFGYDPVFMPDGWNKTFAEASADEKNAVSHRGRAVAKLLDLLETLKDNTL
ncbi:MAG: non-canonical purine NTP diphosphatase [Muribaculaceae bacterium]|nr:non-canonical purine NTP diphosphatase [Muribaculaceae bacterium]